MQNIAYYQRVMLSDGTGGYVTEIKSISLTQKHYRPMTVQNYIVQVARHYFAILP